MSEVVVAKSQPAVDPDLEEVEYVVSRYEYDTDTELVGRLGTMARTIALAAIKRGRTLATPATSA